MALDKVATDFFRAIITGLQIFSYHIIGVAGSKKCCTGRPERCASRPAQIFPKFPLGTLITGGLFVVVPLLVSKKIIELLRQPLATLMELAEVRNNCLFNAHLQMPVSPVSGNRQMPINFIRAVMLLPNVVSCAPCTLLTFPEGYKITTSTPNPHYKIHLATAPILVSPDVAIRTVIFLYGIIFNEM